MWVGSGFPEIRLARCDFVEEILKSSKHIEKSPTYALLKPWLGEGLCADKGYRCFTQFFTRIHLQDSYRRQVTK